jgi:outer membrane murein-binding lipoprotein Lpp
MRISALVIAVACLAVLALPAGAAPPPEERIAQLERQVAALKTKVKQLQQQKTDLLKDAARASRREEALRRYAATEGSCAVTFPNGSQPPDGNIGGPGVHGNGLLWVSLGSPVVVNDADPDGAVPEKFPWWRGCQAASESTAAVWMDLRHHSRPPFPLVMEALASRRAWSRSRPKAAGR